MAKVVHAQLTGHVTEGIFLNEGDEYPADHPLVKSRPELFSTPEPEPEPQPSRVQSKKTDHVAEALAGEVGKQKQSKKKD